MNQEIWKDIPRYKGKYQASNFGRLRNKKTLKVFYGCKDKDGYLITTLRKNGIKKTEKVHRLVAESFLFNPNNYDNINHIDENKLNNRIDNLEWCTTAYNNSYSKSKKVGQYKGNKLIKIWNNSKEAEKELLIWATNIRSCCNGRIPKAGGYIWRFIEV